MSLVATGLYVGDEAAAAALTDLQEAGVTHVLNCTAKPNALEGQAGAPMFLQLGLMDNTSDLPRMPSAMATGVDFIANAISNGGTVLVHCHRGISRSATLAIAYLVRAMQQPAEQVFEMVHACRPIIDPNLGYMVALMEWERRVLPPSARRASSGTLTRGNSFGPSTMVRPLSRAG